MNLDYQTLISLLSQMIWPLGRISGLMLTLPVLSSGMIPTQVKLIVIVSLGLICSPSIPPELSMDQLNGLYLVYMGQEIAVGLMMGFILQLVFQVFVLAGQLVSMQAGMGFATMVDPQSQSSVPLISHMYLIMMSLVFLSLNGHGIVLEALIHSFKLMPVGQVKLNNSLVWEVASFSGWMLKEAVLIAIPALLSLFLGSLAMGIMTRMTPQLNIFSLGFPITLLMGVCIVKLGLPSIVVKMTESLDYGMRFIERIFQ